MIRLPGRATVVGAALLASATLLAPAALAHPLGNFTVNRYSRLELLPDRLQIHYVLDMAEIPTFQERAEVDRNGDGAVDAAEQEAYLARQVAGLARGLQVTLDGAALPLQARERSLAFPDGQGGLKTTRITALFVAPLPAGEAHTLDFRDANYGDRLGWKEIVLRTADGVLLDSATAPATDVSDELRRYPADMLTTPLDRREASASFRVAPGARAGSQGGATLAAGVEHFAPAAALDRSRDALTRLVTTDDLSLPVVALALLLALGLGAAHALSPGHGKTVVAAYLVGSRGTARHAVFLGVTVTATHTIGVFVLGLATLYAAQFFTPEQIYPWLGAASGIMVALIGANLFVVRLRHALRRGPAHAHSHVPTSHPHLHGHGHAHHPTDHHEHHHGEAHAHEHDPVMAAGRAPAYALALGAGMAGAMALARSPGHGATPAHADEHSHRAPEQHHHHHAHDHPHPHDDELDAEAHAYAHAHGLAHSHGGVTHSHLPPGADGRPVTWRSLLALGVSGGLLPCPSALVVLLGAISLHRVGFGLLLVVAFSAGLAAVLTGIGLLFVHARGLLDRLSGSRDSRRRPLIALGLRFLPVASAPVVTLAGVLIALQALAQTGLAR